MKKCLLVTLTLVSLLTVPNVYAWENGANTVGYKLDAPALLWRTSYVDFGLELSKTAYTNVEGGQWDYILENEGGLSGVVKVTVNWSIADLFIKK